MSIDARQTHGSCAADACSLPSECGYAVRLAMLRKLRAFARRDQAETPRCSNPDDHQTIRLPELDWDGQRSAKQGRAA